MTWHARGRLGRELGLGWLISFLGASFDAYPLTLPLTSSLFYYPVHPLFYSRHRRSHCHAEDAKHKVITRQVKTGSVRLDEAQLFDHNKLNYCRSFSLVIRSHELRAGERK